MKCVWLAMAMAVCVGGTAQAQTLSHTLADGRTVSVAARTQGCEDQNEIPDPTFAISLVYGCGVVGSGQDGEGSLLVAHQPGARSPREYLRGHAAALLPNADEAQREALIITADLPTATGPRTFVCTGGENDAGTGAVVYCVLDQPGTQMLVGAQSYDTERVLAVLGLILAGVTIN